MSLNVDEMLRKCLSFIIIFKFCETVLVECKSFSCIPLKNGLRFARNNGLNYVSVDIQNADLLRQCALALWKDSKNGVYLYLRLIQSGSTPISHQDTYLILSTVCEIENQNITKRYVKSIAERGRQSTILVISDCLDCTGYSLIDSVLKAANEIDENLMFYLHYEDTWHIIIKVKNTDRAIVHPLNVTTEMKMIKPVWDLQGLPVTEATGYNSTFTKL